MLTYCVEPRDRLILGDGRSKDNPGFHGRSFDMPPPPTLAGAVRARIGRDPSGHFGLTTEQALAITVHGPLYCELADGGAPGGVFAPAPADALWNLSADGSYYELRRLGPRELPASVTTDLDGLKHIAPSASCGQGAGKAVAGPAWWPAQQWRQWLAGAHDMQRVEHNAEGLPDFGDAGPIHEGRIHVAIDPSTGTALDGALFSFDGIRLQGAGRRRRGLLFRCPDAGLEPGILTLGGKRQLSWLRAAEDVAWPSAPQSLGGSIWRIWLVTPALFDGGTFPRSQHLAGLEIVAAAVGRPQAVTGWDLRRRGDGRPFGAKPMRRLAPAGSIYWVKAPSDDAARAAALDALWLRPLSTDEQAQRDGLGLALVGEGQ